MNGAVSVDLDAIAPLIVAALVNSNDTVALIDAVNAWIGYGPGT